jgi:hypothetical protein
MLAGRQLLATVDAYLADPRSLTEDAVIRLCFVASFFEDIYRTGQIRRFSMLAEAFGAHWNGQKVPTRSHLSVKQFAVPQRGQHVT